MNAGETQFIFMSIFYRQKSWHLLLSAIKKTIFDQPQIRAEIANAVVYLSLNRGAAVRLALKFKKPGLGMYKIIENSIQTFLVSNPSDDEDIHLPATGFFIDFPNNQVKYNLFNERAIMPGRLLDIQLLLSRILLVFFEDHPVDDDGIFTLLVYLQESILNGMCDSEKSKQELCLQVLREMKKNENYISGEMIETANMPELCNSEDAISIPGLSILLADFENAGRMLSRYGGELKSSYLSLLSIIQFQLFKISGDIIFDSTNYIYHSMQETAIKK